MKLSCRIKKYTTPALYIFLLSLLFVCASAVFNNFERLRQGNEAELEAASQSLWSAYQLEFEITRLALAISSSMHRPGDVDFGTLLLRVDVLWSRLAPLLSGENSSETQAAYDVQSLASKIEVTLEDLSGSFQQRRMDRETCEEALARLRSLSADARDLVLAALAQSGNEQTRVQSELSRLYFTNLAALSGLVLTIIGLFYLLLKKLKDLRLLLSKLERDNGRIRFLANHDPLTGLANRRRFFEALEARIGVAAERGQQTALHLIDIDNFKRLNDALGHSAGDQLLRKISSRMSETLGNTVQLGRLGGDEFAAFHDCNTAVLDFAALGRRLYRPFELPFEIGGEKILVRASFGSTVFPRDGRTTAELFGNADIALHSAKASGKCRQIWFDRSMMAAEQRRARLSKEVEQALTRGEFSLRYQPAYSTFLDRIVSFEVLLRWQKSEHEFIPPDEFVPIAEKNGAIIPIGEWLLATACMEIGPSLSGDLSVSINLSPIQLREPDCSSRLLDILRGFDLCPTHFEFEITETSLIGEDPNIIANLETLSRAGAKICLDDFGTGYSCLSHLQSLPMHVMKLDRTFVSKIEEPRTLCICEGIAALGHQLGLTIVGEGAENSKQYDELIRLGCDRIQGNYLSEPLDFDEMQDLLSRRSASEIDIERQAQTF